MARETALVCLAVLAVLSLPGRLCAAETRVVRLSSEMVAAFADQSVSTGALLPSRATHHGWSSEHHSRQPRSCAAPQPQRCGRDAMGS